MHPTMIAGRYWIRSSITMAASQTGTHTAMDVWPRMVHVWQWHAPSLNDGRAAIARTTETLRAALARASAA